MCKVPLVGIHLELFIRECSPHCFFAFCSEASPIYVRRINYVLENFPHALPSDFSENSHSCSSEFSVCKIPPYRFAGIFSWHVFFRCARVGISCRPFFPHLCSSEFFVIPFFPHSTRRKKKKKPKFRSFEKKFPA